MEKDKSKPSPKLDRRFLRRFTTCCKVLFPSCCSTTFLMFVILLGLTIAEQILIYNVGLIPSQFYGVLGDRDKGAFQGLLITAFAIIAVNSVGKSAVQFVSGLLYVKWRRLLTRYLHQEYFKNNNFYEVNVLQDKIDNVDQRISQDVERFCKQLSQMIAVVIIFPFTLCYYTYQCFKSTGWLGPVSIYSYFIVSSIVNRFIMGPIVNLVCKQEKLEGDFRFKHMHVRVNAESAAFYRSGQVEQGRVNRRLQNLLSVQQRLVHFDFLLNFSVNFFAYSGAILSYAVIGIPLFSGTFDDLSPGALSAVISKYAFVSMYLLNCFSQLIDLSNNLSDMAGYVHRIGELLEHLRFTDKKTDEVHNNAALSDEDDDLHSSSSCAFRLKNVTYCAPGADTPLVKDLDLEVVRGTSILVQGKTGCGKSSLLRVMSSLWTPMKGSVQVLVDLGTEGVLFLPQKPLLTDGSLKQQVIYPHKESSLTGSIPSEKDTSAIEKILDEVGLSSLTTRTGGLDFPVEWNWDDMLSPGEMQRLSFARLFYHSPPFAVLDEATSALGIPTEKALYQGCAARGITLVSVGHRDTLVQFHQQILRLDGHGGWQLITTDQTSL